MKCYWIQIALQDVEVFMAVRGAKSGGRRLPASIASEHEPDQLTYSALQMSSAFWLGGTRDDSSSPDLDGTMSGIVL